MFENAQAACASAFVEPEPLGVFNLPDGYQIEKVADKLQLPSSLTWDDQGNLYVAEAGGGLLPQQLAPIRILKVENGYDVRGFHSVKDQIDATLRIEPGRWYGIPDFSASREPLTQPQFEPPASSGALGALADSLIGFQRSATASSPP